MDAFIAAGAGEKKEEKTTSLKKEDLQNFTIFLPREFHRQLKIYSITNGQQMQTILVDLIREGSKSYKKENPDFPNFE